MTGKSLEIKQLLASRRPVLAALALASALASCGEEWGAPRDVVELAAALGQASASVVRPEDIRWEASRGVAGDLVLGRSAVFLGSAEPSGPRDVYRACVRVSPEGRPLSVGAIRNLTSTPLGDDHGLVLRGSRAAFATFAFGQEQGVTLLDLSGEGAQNATRTASDRAMAWVTNLQQTGDGDGVGRVDVTLDQPANRVGLALSDAALEIQLADDAAVRRPTRVARVDLERGELSLAPPGVHADAARHLPKRLVFWAVDTVRAVPWIGPAPIAWLEEQTFAARDALRQLAFKTRGGDSALVERQEAPPAPSVLDASRASVDLGRWPPPPVRSMWKKTEPGEGEWTAPRQPWVKRLAAPPGADAPPSAFFTAFVRPDEERPYSKVLLVAMDTRQLDLQMEAGNEDPRPLTGPPGAGRIPRDPAIYRRVAAAFNGGFKTEHGAYGMMLNKRVLLPPVPGVATVIVTRDARIGMGSWGTSKEVGGIVDVEASDIVSLRQNLDPLVDKDKVNPLGRTQWGFTLPGTSMQTERSGMCVDDAGHLMYAWGDDVNAITLGKAMKMAGCVYGMHLDMNPHHTGFLFTNIAELKGKNYKSELLSTQMEIDTDRYILYAPKDFFYVTLHDPTPPPVGEGVRWEADPGVQPAPAWMPGLWRADAGNVEVLEIEPARASFRVRVGTKEPDSKTGASRAHELSDDDAHRVLFAVTLGTAEANKPRGLVTDGKIALPMSGASRMAALVASEDGQLVIAPAKDAGAAPARADVVELPMLLEDGKALAQAPRAGAALGITPQGRIFVARPRPGATSDDVGKLLVRAGCARAVLLDRGAGSSGVLYRAGTATPPRSRYEDSALYAIGRPLRPRGFRFEPTHPVEPAKKR